jgi:hypothetical protein
MKKPVRVITGFLKIRLGETRLGEKEVDLRILSKGR